MSKKFLCEAHGRFWQVQWKALAGLVGSGRQLRAATYLLEVCPRQLCHRALLVALKKKFHLGIQQPFC